MKKPKKISCFRDLGGIVCADGRKVVNGLLFRSGHLGKLHEADADTLYSDYGISHIVDLRSDSEVTEIPDVVGRAMSYHRFTPLDDEKNPSVNRKNRLGILKRLMAKEGGTRKHLCDTYRSMLTLPSAVEAYRSLIGLLLENKGGVLWHCTQGKDRTGMGTAIVLLALGADRDAILEDYLCYNRLCSFKNAMIFLGVTISRFSLHMARSLQNLMTAQADYLNAAFDEIEQSYGGAEGFLKNVLLLSDETLCRLRSMYLA